MYIDKFRKIVIKIGSSILIDKKGKPKKLWIQEFTKDIKTLIKKKKQVVIVSSGAIAMGCEYLKIKKNGLKVDKSQAVASIGKLINIDKERSIDVIITRLRKKIEVDPKNPKFLQTIRGAGYVLWIE